MLTGHRRAGFRAAALISSAKPAKVRVLRPGHRHRGEWASIPSRARGGSRLGRPSMSAGEVKTGPASAHVGNALAIGSSHGAILAKLLLYTTGPCQRCRWASCRRAPPAPAERARAPMIRAWSWGRGSARTPPCSTSAIATWSRPPIPSRSRPTRLGWYALHVNANDLAVRGARPLWFLATVLLPEGGATELGVERAVRRAARGVRGAGRRARRRPHGGDRGAAARRSCPAACWARWRRTAW